MPWHVAHVPPPSPQSVIVSPGWQTSSESQHPSGQLVALHVAPWHKPATHASPAGHSWHPAPPEPQSFSDVPAWHVPVVSQQPVGQVVALHAETLQTPAVQLSPDGHAAQATPAVPQSAFVTPGWQTFDLSQQPVGHVLALHMGDVHVPPTQVSPDGQVAQEAPPVPQKVVLVPASHSPDLSQQPVGHVEALQGGAWQTPPLQVSPTGHVVHAAPP